MYTVCKIALVSLLLSSPAIGKHLGELGTKVRYTCSAREYQALLALKDKLTKQGRLSPEDRDRLYSILEDKLPAACLTQEEREDLKRAFQQFRLFPCDVNKIKGRGDWTSEKRYIQLKPFSHTPGPEACRYCQSQLDKVKLLGAQKNSGLLHFMEAAYLNDNLRKSGIDEPFPHAFVGVFLIRQELPVGLRGANLDSVLKNLFGFFDLLNGNKSLNASWEKIREEFKRVSPKAFFEGIDSIARAKTDKIDAEKLVKLLKADFLKEVYHSNSDFIELRKIVSAYEDLMRFSQGRRITDASPAYSEEFPSYPLAPTFSSKGRFEWISCCCVLCRRRRF